MGYKDSNLAKVIQAKSRRRLYFGCFLLILSIIILFWQYNFISNLLSGPITMDSKALEYQLINNNVKNININLKLPPDGVYTTGYANINKKVNKYTGEVISQTTESEYYLTTIGSHLLIIEGKPGQLPSGNFSGVIIPLESNIRHSLISDFNGSSESVGLGEYLLPYTLSNKSMFNFPGFWLFLLGIGLVSWGVLLVYRRITDIEDKKHYAYLIAKSMGYNTIENLGADYAESKQAGTVEIGNHYRLSNKFLFADKFFSFKIYPLSQLHWAYKKITKKSLNFIPYGKDYAIVMHFRPKEMVEIKSSEDNINKTLFLLTQLCPETKYGYS
jgi:hypothetical protein